MSVSAFLVKSGVFIQSTCSKEAIFLKRSSFIQSVSH